MTLRSPTVLRLLAIALVVVGSALSLWAARLPMAGFLLLANGIACVAAGTLVLLFCMVAYRSGRERDRRGRALSVLSLATLAGVPILFVLLYYDVPFRVFLAANRSAMDTWAQQMSQAGSTVPASARVGWYDFEEIEPIPGGMRCYVAGAGFFRAAGGFAYCVSGVPAPASPADEYTSIGGNWYRRREERP